MNQRRIIATLPHFPFCIIVLSILLILFGTSDIRAEESMGEKEISIPVAAPSVNGALQVIGTQLSDSEGNPVQLKGISTHGIAWYPDYINADCFAQLPIPCVTDWLRRWKMAFPFLYRNTESVTPAEAVPSNEDQANQRMDLFDHYGISCAAWNLSNKNETCAILCTDCGQISGFTGDDLTDSGKWLYRMLTGN